VKANFGPFPVPAVGLGYPGDEAFRRDVRVRRLGRWGEQISPARLEFPALFRLVLGSLGHGRLNHPPPAGHRPRAKRCVAFRFMAVLAVLFAAACAPTRKGYKLSAEYSVDDPQFERTMGSLLGPPIVPGNAAATLVNGDQIFPAMLDAIHGARESITFETFIYWSGPVGRASR